MLFIGVYLLLGSIFSCSVIGCCTSVDFMLSDVMSSLFALTMLSVIVSLLFAPCYQLLYLHYLLCAISCFISLT